MTERMRGETDWDSWYVTLNERNEGVTVGTLGNVQVKLVRAQPAAKRP
jgi:hypothetical protein